MSRKEPEKTPRPCDDANLERQLIEAVKTARTSDAKYVGDIFDETSIRNIVLQITEGSTILDALIAKHVVARAAAVTSKGAAAEDMLSDYDRKLGAYYGAPDDNEHAEFAALVGARSAILSRLRDAPSSENDENMVTNVSRAIGCTTHMDNHQIRAKMVLKAVRGEWVPPKPTNPQDQSALPDCKTDENFVDPVDALLETGRFIPGIQPGECYERTHDDCDGNLAESLRVMIGHDGDVHLLPSLAPHKSLRFRNCAGGGMSLRTHHALLLLAEAIRRDNLGGREASVQIESRPTSADDYVAELRNALRPFAKFADHFDGEFPDRGRTRPAAGEVYSVSTRGLPDAVITVEALMTARKLVARTGGGK